MKLIVPLPKDILVCCSGGVDSISAAHRLISKKYHVTLYHFNHGTPSAPAMEEAVRKFARDHNVDCLVHQTDRKLAGEAEFREARIKFLQDGNFNAITAHHLQDASEQYVMNFMTGAIRSIPMNVVSKIGGSRVFHPFLTTAKSEFIKYAQRKTLGRYIVEDPTNADPDYGRRNWVRNVLIPQIRGQKIGIDTIVRKQYLKYISNHPNAICI